MFYTFSFCSQILLPSPDPSITWVVSTQADISERSRSFWSHLYSPVQVPVVWREYRPIHHLYRWPALHKQYIVYTVYLQCTCKSALHCYTVYGKWRTNVFFPLVGDILVTNWECIPENCVWRAFSSLKIHGKSFNFWALFLKNIFLQHSNCLSLVECK